MGWRCAIGATLLALATGCGGDRGPALVSVHGRVTLDGKALGLKSVRFVPEQGTPGAGGEGTTQEDGTYSLFAVRPGALKAEQGVPPGSYAVVVTEPAIPISTPQPKETPGEPAPAVAPADLISRKRSLIPPAYFAAETTKLRVQVPKSGGSIDLKLSSRP